MTVNDLNYLSLIGSFFFMYGHINGLLKVSNSRKQFMAKWILQKNERWISALEDYNTKRESIFFFQEDRLSFVLTLK